MHVSFYSFLNYEMSVVIGLDISVYRIYLFIIDNFTRNETQPARNHIKPNIRKVEKNQNSSLGGRDLWWPTLISCHVVCHFWCHPSPKNHLSKREFWPWVEGLVLISKFELWFWVLRAMVVIFFDFWHILVFFKMKRFSSN